MAFVNDSSRTLGQSASCDSRMLLWTRRDCKRLVLAAKPRLAKTQGDQDDLFPRQDSADEPSTDEMMIDTISDAAYDGVVGVAEAKCS